ncbi:hypothetical protein QVD17_36917 [Tagetes erecta]|uniref:Transcription initiation factor TFIID subunit 9 n=1 Tax=Tagetes erecta TaxID=13708 RepID=A0AAD8JZK0_TARER|nr:hypothetical protein QVD17_36917 [Tagetes erecta]
MQYQEAQQISSVTQCELANEMLAISIILISSTIPDFSLLQVYHYSSTFRIVRRSLDVATNQAINRMGAGDDNLPRDAKTIIALLKSMSVDSYEPSVVHQFLEIYYRNAVDLLMDAKTYSNHAGKARVDYADVMLAIKSKSYFSFTRLPLPVVKDAAMKVNSKPIPKAPTCWPSLPPERDTLIASNYQVIIQKNQSSEADEEQEMENDVKIVENAPKTGVCFPKTRQERRTNLLPGSRQRVSFPLGVNRRR